MKKLNVLFFVVIIMLISVCCSKKENIIEDINCVPISDSLTAHKADNTNDSLIPKKYIYLTIDDAPINGSEYIDSVILAEKIKTNIFMVGNAVDGSGRFLKYFKQFQKNIFIEIYNHSYSHANNKYASYYKSPQNVLEDFEKNQTTLNISHKIVRLPGRNLWRIGDKKKNYQQTGSTSAELLAEKGYNIFGWDIEWKYNAKDYSPKQDIDSLVNEIEDLYNTSKTFTSKHVILLVHNQMFGNVNDKNNLGILIDKLKEKNFSFEYLSSYPVSQTDKNSNNAQIAKTTNVYDTASLFMSNNQLFCESIATSIYLETEDVN